MSKTLPPLPALPPAEVQEWSESWITLRGEGWTRETVEKYASDYALAAIEAQGVPDVDSLTDAIAEGLRGTYHCTRVWEAWHVGTMDQDDFEPVDESDTPRELAETVIAMLAAAPPAPQPQQPGAWSERIKELADQYAIECVEFSKSIPNGAHSMSPIAVKAGDTRLDLHSAIDTAERLIRAIESATLAAQVERATQPQPEQDGGAYKEAATLATALFKKHFSHEEHYASGRVVWGLCDTAAGVISQIDNMVSGLIQPQPVQQEPVVWLPIETAPKDSSMLRLLVNFDDHSLEDGSDPCWTIGTNALSDTGVDAWLFAGWDWTHDRFTQGTGTPIGWLPMLYTSPQAAQPLAETQSDALNTLCKMLHSGEEVEGDDGLAMLVPMDLWNEAQDAIELLIGEDDGTEAAHGIKKGTT